MRSERIRLFSLVIVCYLLPVLVVVFLEITRSKESAVILSKQSLSHLVDSRAEKLDEHLAHGADLTQYLATSPAWKARLGDASANGSISQITTEQEAQNLAVITGSTITSIAVGLSPAGTSKRLIPGDPSTLLHIPYEGEAAVEYIAYSQGDVFVQYAAPFSETQVFRHVIRDARITNLMTEPFGHRSLGQAALVASDPFTNQIVLPAPGSPIPQQRKDPTYPLTESGLWASIGSATSPLWYETTWRGEPHSFTWSRLSVPGLSLAYFTPSSTLEVTATAPMTFSFMAASGIGLLLTVFLIMSFLKRYKQLYSDYSKAYYEITKNAHAAISSESTEHQPADVEGFKNLLNATLTQLQQRNEDTARDKQRILEEKEYTENALRQASKSIAAGEMASYVAHNVNQPLTELHLLIESNLENKSDFAVPFSHKDVEDMLSHIQRIADITTAMRQISSRRQSEVVSKSVRDLIKEAYSTPQRRIQQSGIHFDYSAVPDVNVAVAPNDIIVALFNLINNAIDAILSSSGRTRTRFIRMTGEVRKNRCYLSIEDSGSGISEEELARIREPGYSTKGTMGVGLSSVESAVSQYGGKLVIESALDVGTTITFDLPLAGI